MSVCLEESGVSISLTFRWCNVFCSVVRLRSEDGRRSVFQKRGSLSDYQQHVRIFAFYTDKMLGGFVCVCVFNPSVYSGLILRPRSVWVNGFL